MMNPFFKPPAMTTLTHPHAKHPPVTPQRQRRRALIFSLLAYVSFVSISVAAAVALIGDELPLEVLVKVL